MTRPTTAARARDFVEIGFRDLGVPSVEPYIKLITELLDGAVADETIRCAMLVTMRGDIARASAKRIRAKGTYKTRSLWPPFRKSLCVLPQFEVAARDMELIGEAFDVVAHCIRRGYDPRDLAPHEKSDEKMMHVEPGVDGDPTLRSTAVRDIWPSGRGDAIVRSYQSNPDYAFGDPAPRSTPGRGE